MTIREIAENHGVSVQSIYKKLKNRKINLATLKDSTGQLTEAGEKQILELLKAAPADSTGLNPEVERLKTEIQLLTEKVEILTNERDYLRTALEHEQALNGLALQRIALPAPERSTGFSTRLKRWFKKGSDEDGNEGK